MSESTQTAPTADSPLDLLALDAAMSPLRRVVRYAVLSDAAMSEVRYLGAIGARWVERARKASGGQLAEQFDGLAAALASYDALDGDEALAVLAGISAHVAAIDRVFGLPIPPQRSRGKSRRRGQGDARPETAEARAPKKGGETSGGGKSEGGRAASRGQRSSGRSRKRKSDDAVAAQSTKQAPSEPSEAQWWGPSVAGRSVADLEGAADVAEALSAAGVQTVDHLLGLPIVGEEVLQPIVGSGRLREPGRAAVGGRVRVRYERLTSAGQETVVVLHGAGPTEARWAGGAPRWLVEQLEPGRRTVLVGQVEIPEEGPAILRDGALGTDDGKHAARMVSYGIDGAPDEQVRSLVAQALVDAQNLREPLPGAVVEEHALLGLGTALQRVHQQGSRAEQGLRRLKFDEALLAQLAMLWPRFGGNQERGIPHTLLHGLVARFLQLVDDDLNDEQQAAFEAIKRDLRSPMPMRRVLTGEVGAGKGLVAVLSAVVVAENKSQAMVLTPDAATAEQRYAFTQPILRELGLVGKLYSDKPSKAQRDALRRGEVHVLFGPTTLLEADLEFRRLGLVVAGERDTFGAVGKLCADLRAPRPDVLVVTSTPVPQQVLLASYPTFDLTVLRRGFARPVPCEVIDASDREIAYQAAAEAVERGEQVAVVFPMRDGEDVLDVRDAMRVVSALESRVLAGARIRLFHGAMSMDERNRVYDDFRRHRADVLVATTHLEAGPPIDGVSRVIIEQADRMRPSRLHRVRGHICGGRFEPKCFLVTGEHPDADGVDLVRRIARSRDGFSVSAQELADRGFESMVVEGTEPGPQLRRVHPVQDLDLLVTTRAVARALLEKDPGLRRGGNQSLARYLKVRWSEFYDTPCPVQAGGGGGGRRRRRRRKR